MIVRMLPLGGALLAAAHREVPEGLPGRYRSVLPVDGRPGLEFTVVLDEAGDYTFDYAYIEWKTRQSERGTYRMEGDTVACVPSWSDRVILRFVRTQGALRMLDGAGGTIENEFSDSYIFRKQD